jgi:high affinity Mn2+ porin
MFKKSFLYFFMLPIILVKAQVIDSTRCESFSIHYQATIVNQSKSAFSTNYSGDNSLSSESENQTSITSTLFLGARLWQGGSVFLNPEIAGGSGLSKTCGVAASTNGETFRVGDPQPKVYLARLFYHQIFSISNSREYQEDDYNQISGSHPTHYLGITIGKISIADYFDNNQYSHDPRTQFLSWGLMSNGAYDYPANTRGYTPSILLEYVSPTNEIHYGISLVPLIANGNDMNWNISKAKSQVVEYTHRYKMNGRKGAVRFLSFYTSTNMGNYRQSIASIPLNTLIYVAPEIEQTRKYGNTKYGFGFNAEHEINSFAGCFFKASWNDGNNETWAFTEIDRSMSAGLSLSGDCWKRKNDRFGIAQVISGLSNSHKEYLSAGGNGFMLGDGHLNYGNEYLTEMYYSAELLKNQIYLTGTYQLLINPGYNLDRKGPVNIISVRLHVEI